MFNQETLYQHIFKEQWKEILDALYLHRKSINEDNMLSHAATIFENAFFSKVKDYGVGDNKVKGYLDILYVLNHGKFYTLSDNNYKLLIVELVKRGPLKEAINYAKLFPEEPDCKNVLELYKESQLQEELNTPKKTLPMNWIEIFNRLFELINDKDDPATYFSGPRFVNVIREIQPYFPDYSQYIDQRNQEGKSTSRKIFYYDILIGLNIEQRQQVIKRMLEILVPFQPEKVNRIEVLLGQKPAIKQPIIQTLGNDKAIPKNPKVFISYSWDDEQHKEWVLKLANSLRSNGIDVILDRYFLKAGKSITHFVENAINLSERIIIIFTPNYKLKADKRAGGVGYEYSIMNSALYQNQIGNEKIIPVLRSGNLEESIPVFMHQYIHLDLRNDATFDISYKDILREIYNEPEIVIPEIGIKPEF